MYKRSESEILSVKTCQSKKYLLILADDQVRSMIDDPLDRTQVGRAPVLINLIPSSAAQRSRAYLRQSELELPHKTDLALKSPVITQFQLAK